MQYKIAQLILTPGHRAATTNEVFISQPDANREVLGGKLFILAEINSKNNYDRKILDFLLDNIFTSYYNNEKIILREKITSIKVEHIFETSLMSVNNSLVNFLENQGLSINFDFYNLTVGVICQNQLHLSNSGKNRLFLLHKKNPDNNYKITDILGGAKDKNPKPIQGLNNGKLFSNIISGKIPDGGYVVITNEAVPEYISTKQLLEIVSTLPPASAVEQIKNILERVNAYASFLGIIFKNTVGQDSYISGAMPEPLSAKDSVQLLNNTENQTEKLLSTSGTIDLKKWLRIFTAFFNKNNRFSKKVTLDKTLLLKEKIFSKKRTAWFSPSVIANKIYNILSYLGALATALFNFFADWKKIKTAPIRLAQSTTLGLNSIRQSSAIFFLKTINWFKSLKMINKILLTVSIILLALLAQNIFIINLKSKNNELQDSYDNLAKLIEQKQSQVEANLLYHNDEGAKKLFTEIQGLLEQLPQKTEGQKEHYSELQGKYNLQIEKIQRAIRVSQMDELTNLTDLESQAKPDGLYLLNDKIFIADQARKTLFSLEPKNKLTTIEGKFASEQPEKIKPFADNKSLYYLGRTVAWRLEESNKQLTKLNITINNPSATIGATAYSGRLYVIDKTEQQILRYKLGTNAITGRQKWLKNSSEFSNAIDLAVDGNIYVLYSNGKLGKFFKGEEQSFRLDLIDPPLEKPTKLLVLPEKDFIYILESEKNRLLAFDKNGKFLNQYLWDDLTEVKDFAIDETNKKIFLLNQATIYSFTAENF